MLLVVNRTIYPLPLLRSDEINVLLKDSTIAELQYTLVEQCNLFTKKPQNLLLFYFIPDFQIFGTHLQLWCLIHNFLYSLYLNINFVINYLNFFIYLYALFANLFHPHRQSAY
jgi:hypothetical protein